MDAHLPAITQLLDTIREQVPDDIVCIPDMPACPDIEVSTAPNVGASRLYVQLGASTALFLSAWADPEDILASIMDCSRGTCVIMDYSHDSPEDTFADIGLDDDTEIGIDIAPMVDLLRDIGHAVRRITGPVPRPYEYVPQAA